jgi:hypothetical protein
MNGYIDPDGRTMLKWVDTYHRKAARRRTAAFAIFAALLTIAGGCKEQGPVELVGGGTGGAIEIVTPPPQPMPGMELGDADTAGIVPLPPQKFAGHILIAGARYDGPLAGVEATLSRVILFDFSSPVQLMGNRVSYRTLDAGTVDLDGTPLAKVPKTVRMMGADTTLGVQYILYNERPGGFRYTGGMPYAWTGTGNGPIPPFTVSITAPPKLVVETPTPESVVSANEDLRARWSGGGETVQLVISIAGDPRVDSRPILHLRLGKNRGGVLIPARILRLLPQDRDRFVFTFFSDSSHVTTIGGFPDDVLVQALTSHSILVRMTR